MTEGSVPRRLSSESLEASLEASPPPMQIPPMQIDYVRMLVLDKFRERALMEDVDGLHWDLPYFVLPGGMKNDVIGCCEELQKQLGYYASEALLAGVAEMLGETGCTHPRGNREAVELGHAKLLIMEAMNDTILESVCELSTRFHWKDLSFVESIKPDDAFDPSACFSYVVVREALSGEEALRNLLPNPPFQLGWFRKSSAWLTEEIEKLGNITTCAPIQYMLSPSSAIVGVDSNDGIFFLKGVSAGSRELQVTAVVKRLFPMRTPELVAINERLQAFITREFDKYNGDSPDIMLSTLLEVQKVSAMKEAELISGGVLPLRPSDIEGMLKCWKSDQTFIETIGPGFAGFEKSVPGLIKMAQELAEYNLPLCLVHGDFSKRNMGMKETKGGGQEIILHDWQFAVVGHPFYEFHDMREGWDDIIDEYLRMWSDFESLERCREAYERAKVLGWLPKAIGTLECIRQGDVAKPFGASISRAFFKHIMLIIEREVEYRCREGLLIF